MKFLYNLVVRSYFLAIRAAAVRNRKAALFVEGRREAKKIIGQKHDGRWIWMHCASLGEFEQGRPVLEALREKFPEHKFLLTFFSPSGYEVRKNYPGADLVMYLPEDSARNAEKMLSVFQFRFVLFVKYEFWHYQLEALKERGVPVYLVSAVFRPGQIFFKPWGGFFRKMLTHYAHIFVQDEASGGLLQAHGIRHVTVSGDTRFDRVLQVAAKPSDLKLPAGFDGREKILVAGSTWPEDEKVLQQFFEKYGRQAGWRLIIAPHEVNDASRERLLKLFGGDSVLLSSAAVNDQRSKKVLVVDSIGLLSQLYRYGSVAYVGGGFGKGIHNILEAAVYGVPVLFGPKHRKFREASQLIKIQGAREIKNYQDLLTLIQLFEKSAGDHERASRASGEYVRNNSGATNRIEFWLYRQIEK